jgi:hypothetical protein
MLSFSKKKRVQMLTKFHILTLNSRRVALFSMLNPPKRMLTVLAQIMEAEDGQRFLIPQPTTNNWITAD